MLGSHYIATLVKSSKVTVSKVKGSKGIKGIKIDKKVLMGELNIVL